MLPYLVPMLPVMNRTTDGMTSGDTPDEMREGTARRNGGENELGKTAQGVGNAALADKAGGRDGLMRKTAPLFVSSDGTRIR